MGIAMGNCAAPPLAIIYMDHIESKILAASSSLVVWKRYIDDIFFVTNSSSEELLQVANSINSQIQFTLENPVNNEIPFLDTLVHVDNGLVSFELFIKPTHSGTCLPFDAYVPQSRKKCLVIAETIRTQRIASPHHKTTSLAKINRRLLQNAYPQGFLDRTISQMNATPRDQPDFLTYVKIPFLSEAQRQSVLRLCRRTGLTEHLRLIFTTERSNAWQFRPRHEIQSCPSNCMACATSERPSSCFRKNSVYRVTCVLCGARYVGQTDRTMRSRIIEHIQTSSSHVHQHMVDTHGEVNRMQFKWRVIGSHPHTRTRLAIEALFIRREGNLMNGCEGTVILPYLKMNH
jgi:hypothetical protein